MTTTVLCENLNIPQCNLCNYSFLTVEQVEEHNSSPHHRTASTRYLTIERRKYQVEQFVINNF